LRFSQGVSGAVCIGLFATGCAGSSAPPSTTPGHLLADGTSELLALQSVQLTGHFMIDQTEGSVRAWMLRDGDSSGLLTLGGESSNFVEAGGNSYFESLVSFVTSQFPSLEALASSVKGPPWYRTTGSQAAAAVVQLITSNQLLATFLGGRPRLTQKNGKDSRGRAAILLSDAAGTVFVAAASPHAILEVTTAAHYLAGSFTNLDLVFDDRNAPISVAVPTKYVIPDLVHMPPHFYIQSYDFKSCNSTGCTLTAVVQADAGSGVASVSLSIASTTGERLGACTAVTTLPTYFASETAACRIHGAAWTAWWNAGVGHSTITAVVANPDYYS
jgi:hypothetical protein